MTISLIKSPAAVNTSGNDIEFKINNYFNNYSTLGTNAVLFVSWATGDSDTDTFKISWGANEITFTCATIPDDSGNQYQTYTSGSVDEWVSAIANDFNSNYQLTKDFVITKWPSGIISFESKTKTALHTLLLSDISGSNISEDTNISGADPVTRDFYNIICRVYQVGSLNTLLGEDRLYPDSNGHASFKIQEYFESLLDFSFEWPEGTTDFLFKKTDRIARFFVEYAETYDNVVRKLYSTKETETHAFLAGIDKNKVAQLNEENKTWWDKFLYKKDFLTYQPRTTYVNKKQPVKLNFLVWKDVTEIKLKIKATYTGNSIHWVTKNLLASKFDIIECILSVQKLGIDTLSPGNNLLEYEVYIVDQDDVRVSISRYFIVDDIYRENERIFIFKNSLGSPDVLRCIGVSEVNTEMQRNSFERLNTQGFTWKDFESQNFDISEIQKFKFNTGWMDELSTSPTAMADYLREFYLSDQVYELISNRLYPIKLTSKKALIGRSNESLVSFEFEAERAYSDTYFTRDENIHPVTGFESKFIEDEYLNP